MDFLKVDRLGTYLEGYTLHLREAPRNALVQSLGLGLSTACLASYWLNSNTIRPAVG